MACKGSSRFAAVSVIETRHGSNAPAERIWNTERWRNAQAASLVTLQVEAGGAYLDSHAVHPRPWDVRRRDELGLGKLVETGISV